MAKRTARRIPEAAEALELAQWPLLWALSLVALAAFGVLVTVHAGNDEKWTAFENLSKALAAAVAGLACASRATREHREGVPDSSSAKRGWRAWRLLAYGMGAWAAGHVVRSIYEVALGITPKVPSPVDGALLISAVLVIGGLLGMVSTPAGRLSHLRGALEGLLIAVGCFLISWCAVIAAVFATTGASLSGIVNLAYPALDAVALSAVLFVALRGREELPAGLGLLALGIAFLAISDSSYWYLNALNPHFPKVTPIDIGWVAGFLVITVAAAQRPRSEPRRQGALTQLLGPGLPTVPAMLGILTAIASWLAGRSLGPSAALLSISAALVLLALLLQLIVVYENHALTTYLERRVERRTAELRATELYYRALVQHSSDVIIVVNPDLTLRDVSDSMMDIFGFEPGAFVARDLDVLTGGANALTHALRHAATQHGHLSRVEWELTDATGRVRNVESAITNLTDDSSVGAFVLNTRDVTDQVALEQQLRHQAFHDPLTGLANRALLMDRAEQALARSARSGATVAVVLVDLDGFKSVNDSLGHQVGDIVLGEVAHRLHSLVRTGDTVARLGGDEFVILIDDVSGMEETRALAERVREVLRPGFALSGWDYAVTASVGVATGSASDVNVHDLLRDADTAMYVAKTSGKDSVRLFAPSMHERAHERFQLQVDLREALDHSDLLLFYQPIYDVNDSRLKGFEALVRWSHPTRGLMAPARFIPLAEENGLIVPLGRWVLREAVRQLSIWDRRHESARALSMSVNVSTVQLSARSLIGDVKDALEQFGIDPARLVLEITEGALAADATRVVEMLDQLRALGVRIAIDDFGTGYASLSHLQQLPVDILKVDRSFLTSVGNDENSRELLKAILGVGQALSLSVVAEGIEAEGQMDVLQELGCEMAQGFLVGKPSPAEIAERLLSDDAPAPDVRSPGVASGPAAAEFPAAGAADRQLPA